MTAPSDTTGKKSGSPEKEPPVNKRPGKSLLVAEDVVKTYRDGDVTTEVLKGANLSLNAGELVALMGPSGSGKSTLLSILGTLLKPTSGSVHIANQEVTHLAGRKLNRFRNRHIGFVFQFHHLLPDFSAVENVMMPTFAANGTETRQAKERALELLRRVGLEDRASYRSTKLSGGQKQRVAIARALVMNPDIVFADEPTGNLDLDSSGEVLDLVREMCNQESTTFFVSTHDHDVAARCDRVVEVVDGKVVGAPVPE